MDFEWAVGLIPLSISWLSFSIWLHDKRELQKNEVGILVAAISCALAGLGLIFYLM